MIVDNDDSWTGILTANLTSINENSIAQGAKVTVTVQPAYYGEEKITLVRRILSPWEIDMEKVGNLPIMKRQKVPLAKHPKMRYTLIFKTRMRVISHLAVATARPSRRIFFEAVISAETLGIPV